jgi:hypothetical protein
MVSENLPNVTECDSFLWLWHAEKSAPENESELRTLVHSLLAGKYSYTGVSQLGDRQRQFL